MTHPLFARLDRQLARAKEELAHIEAAEQRELRLKRNAPRNYDQWAHNASIAEGIRATYSGLESILEAIAKEIDDFVSTGDSWHAELVETMAFDLSGTRPAVISKTTRELMDELRRFRHIVNHKYALELKRSLVRKNLNLLRKCVPLFEKDYSKFVRVMTKEDDHDGGRSSSLRRAGRRQP
ncbi:MAG: hypothetical protein HY323_17390 [Betaproteobacteria bacterium]|nr:hypothetical protein [Betaproteobacteria bacterium]MBI3938747.1 hypothetical protein [Betaproteobacteria bacterium]